MVERKIGEVFKDTHGELVICVEAMNSTCEGCIYIADATGCINTGARGFCSSNLRSDNKDVIYKKAD